MRLEAAHPKDGDSKKLFFTTSDLMNTMNDVLEKLKRPDDNFSPRFELQKRLPNGSTVKASEKDLKVADMDSKFKQAALEVEGLTTTKKIEWAKNQRLEGNQLYASKNFAEAIDVYLTCLVVKSDDLEFIDQVFLPVMNNLAQCTLQLGNYKKTQNFCTMALDEERIFLLEKPELISKLYFRRAKASRLSGEYVQAQKDLKQARHFLSETSKEHEAIEKELRMVELSSREAKKMESRQQQAMKQAFEIQSEPLAVDNKQLEALSDAINNKSEKKNSLYGGRKRNYSTLRAKEKPALTEDRSVQELSYWEYYMAVIGAIAERLLLLLGDEETIAKEKDKIGKVK